MRLHYVEMMYSFGGAPQSLERHYRELRDDLLWQGRHYGVHGMLQQSGQWRPPADIHETERAILVKLELAGMREDQLDVLLYQNALVVSGKREDDVDHDEELCYHEAQVHYGPFRAEIVLPTPIRAEEVAASYENGFLRIRLPKAVPSEPGLSGSRHHKGTRETQGDGGQGHLDATSAGFAATAPRVIAIPFTPA